MRKMEFPRVLLKAEIREIRLGIPKLLWPDHAEGIHDAENVVPKAAWGVVP